VRSPDRAAHSPQDPLRQNLVRRLQPPGTSVGGITYLLGTDQLGRDTFSRVLFGAQSRCPSA